MERYRINNREKTGNRKRHTKKKKNKNHELGEEGRNWPGPVCILRTCVLA
jgi:hypothetical protein